MNNHETNPPDPQDAWETPAELKSLEMELARLRPSEDRLDREALIFKAGRASVIPTVGTAGEPSGPWFRSAVFWSRSFGGMTVLAATLLAMLLTQDRGVTEMVLPLQNTAQVETVHSPASRFQAPRFQASRSLSQNTLSAAPYCLRQMDQLLATSSTEPLSTFHDKESSEEIHQNTRPPKSMLRLLKESIDAEFLPFDSSSATPNLGAPS